MRLQAGRTSEEPDVELCKLCLYGFAPNYAVPFKINREHNLLLVPG